ncbi:hypothetical protein EYF80_016125 [Liparis tanakae]|uniref:Uncharacterized protein n=1 Tax=Liparis tanakae TaxID=230148 RepID=A0A4Z2I6T6_9TELE|nr:hypothetical protein EYF80_016125 [Liparis tanakae]
MNVTSSRLTDGSVRWESEAARVKEGRSLPSRQEGRHHRAAAAPPSALSSLCVDRDHMTTFSPPPLHLCSRGEDVFSLSSNLWFLLHADPAPPHGADL